MVSDIFDATAVAGLKGWMGVGHGECGESLGIRWEGGVFGVMCHQDGLGVEVE